MATYSKTVDPNGGADYASIALWEAGEQSLYTSGDIAIADCIQTGPVQDTTPVTISGWTSGVIPKVIVNPSYRHDGTVAGSGYQLSPTGNDTPLTVDQPYTVIDGLKIKGNTSQAYKNGIRLVNFDDGGIVKNCLVYDWGNTGSTWRPAIYHSGANNKADDGIIYNNIVIAYSSCGSVGVPGIQATNNYDSISVLNNTVYGFNNTDNIGIKVGGDSGHIIGVVKNNVVIDCAVCYDTTYALDLDNNVSSDATAPGTTVAINKTSYGTYFEDYAAGDLHLTGASLDLFGIASEDLSSIFTDDIDGNTRPSSTSFGLGADFYVAATVDTTGTINNVLGDAGVVASGTALFNTVGTLSGLTEDITSSTVGTIIVQSLLGINETLGNTSSSAEGILLVQGSSSETLDAITSAISTSVTINGALISTLDSSAVSTSGIVGSDVIGSVSKTLDSISTSESSGTVRIRCVLSSDLDDFTLIATPDNSVYGTISGELGILNFSASGTLEVRSSLSSTIQDVYSSCDGIATVRGSTSTSLSDISSSFEGVLRTTGQMSSALDAFLMASTAKVVLYGNILNTLYDFQMVGEGEVVPNFIEGVISSIIDDVVSSAVGYTEIQSSGFSSNETMIAFFREQTGLDSFQFNELATAYYKQVAASNSSQFNDLLAGAQKSAGFVGLSPTDWRNF